MMKLMKSLLPILWLGLMVFFYGLALSQNHQVEGAAAVQILYAQQPITVREGVALLEREEEQEHPLSVALWGEMPGQTLHFVEFDRQVEVDVVVVSGDSSLLFPAGFSLQLREENEILLSSDVAFRLFGTSTIVDGANFYPVHLGGREYTIRGVLFALENTVVIQGHRGLDRILDGAAVEIPQGQHQRNIIREFELRFWPVERVFDGMMVRTWGNIFTWLLPVVVGITLFIGAIKEGMSYRERPVKCIAWIGGVALFSALFIGLHRDLPAIHLNISPPMWSDFGYWRDFIGDKAGAIGQMFQDEWRAPQQLMLMNAWRIMQGGLLATGIFVLFIRKMKMEKWWLLLFYCGASMGAAFWVITNTQRGELTGVMSLWWLPSLYLMGKNWEVLFLSPYSSHSKDGESVKVAQ